MLDPTNPFQKIINSKGLFQKEDPFIPQGYAQAMKTINKGKLPTYTPGALPSMPTYSEYRENQMNAAQPLRLSTEQQAEIAGESFGYKYKKSEQPNWGQAALGTLMGFDALIPPQKLKDNRIDEPLSYNPNPYGTGSQAIYKNGGKIADLGMTLGGEEPQPKKFKNIVDKQKYWDTLPGKYGRYVKNREAWMDWTGNKLGNATVKDMTLSAAKAAKLNPALLYSSAMEEGMNMRIKDPSLVSDAYEAANKKGALKDYAVDGFFNYGLDRFGERYDSLVKGGYLKDDFKNSFTAYEAFNEKKEKIKTAAFRDDSSALQAKAAMIAAERDAFLGYAKKKNVQLSPEATDFFTLAAYNGGLGNAQKMLDYYNISGALKDNAFLKKKPKDYGGIYDNVMKCMQGADMLKGEGYFENGGTLPTLYEHNKSYDLSPEEVKSLLAQGYELDFE